jgi:hypothetical protein
VAFDDRQEWEGARFMANFRTLDAQRDELRRAHPGWRIWFVPHASDGSVTWCAQREPGISTDTPEHLSEEIKTAEAAHALGTR